MKFKDLPPLEILHDCFELDGDCPSGLRWKTRSAQFFISPDHCKAINKQYEGRPAGTKTSVGYYVVRVMRKIYLSHRIVYALKNHTVDLRGLIIDHIDRNKGNNRVENLRLVTFSENVTNLDRETKAISSKNTSGTTNIYFNNLKRRWVVKFYLKGVQKRKSFKSFEEAANWQKEELPNLPSDYSGRSLQVKLWAVFNSFLGDLPPS